MTCKYIDMPDGSIKVEYDPPESDHSRSEDGQAIEYKAGLTFIDGGEVFATQVLDAKDRMKWKMYIPQHVAELCRRARAKLAPGTIFEIRAKIPTDYGTSMGLAWYTNPWLQDAGTEELQPYPGTINALGGYCYMGRFRA